MTADPQTRHSLILRLQRGSDAAAWDEFAAIYRPIIVRLAGQCGLQDCDAEDVAQRVLLAVSKHIVDWQQNPERARFRTWLQRIVRNSAINVLTRRPWDAAQGGTTVNQSLREIAAQDDDVSEQWNLEWRRAAFRWASAEVRDEVQPSTWEAFWLSAVEGIDPQEVAERTHKSIGSVYVARSRVMQRIQAKLQEVTSTDAADFGQSMESQP